MSDIGSIVLKYPALLGILVGMASDFLHGLLSKMSGKTPSPAMKSILTLLLPILAALVSAGQLYLQGHLDQFDIAAFLNLLQVLLGSLGFLHAKNKATPALKNMANKASERLKSFRSKLSR